MHPTGMSRTILGQLARQRGLDPFSYLCNTAANADHSQQTDMTISKRIAGLLGPTLMAVLASEYPAVQPHLYDEQIPPVVYLSGLLMFVAGLSIVRWHNQWRRDWTLSVTLSGWFLLALGAVRMFAAGMYRRASRDASAGIFLIGETVLFAIGILMTWKAYRRDAS
jgi:hypothetical protein